MKKIIVIVLLLLPALFSAETMFGQVSLGPKIGFNASKLSSSIDSVKADFKSGFQIGAFVRLGKKLYLQPELYYTTQGGVFTSNTQNWKQTVKIGSLDVPVLVGYKLLNAKLVNVRILAGPAASFVVNKSIAEGGSSTGPITNGDMKSVNWSIQAGAGVDVWKFTLDVRYQIGLNSLVKEAKNWNFDSKNNVWVISLGFKII
ncbi:MAG: porin family protein [Bacteroidales bacterium]|nr:porin family protein [Bacteroidales bacterium]